MSDDSKKARSSWLFLVVAVTVGRPLGAGQYPATEPLCPALRPVRLVDLRAEERLFGWL